MKFQETIKLLEENIFKPASNEEAVKRQQQYALIQINNILKNQGGHQNPDGSWDVDRDVDISRLYLTEIPVKFNKVNSDFICSFNKLTSLYGCPKEVKGSFICSYNHLTSLEECPKVVEYTFGCSHNKLISLEGCPEIVKSSFNCSSNNLTSLEGCPKIVKGNFNCHNNDVKFSNEYVRKYCKVGGLIYT